MACDIEAGAARGAAIGMAEGAEGTLAIKGSRTKVSKAEAKGEARAAKAAKAALEKAEKQVQAEINAKAKRGPATEQGATSREAETMAAAGWKQDVGRPDSWSPPAKGQ